MTREEAIKIMIQTKEVVSDYHQKAFEMAIQALSQEPTIQDKQAESEKFQKAFDDGYANGYAQARFDYEKEPCDKCVYSTKDGYCQYDDITETIPPFEPCEDAISLTKEAYSDLCLRASKADDLQRALDMEKGAYNALVKNIQCDDAISREMALKECHDIVVDGERYRVIQEETLLGLPPVTQKSGKRG